MKESVDAGDGKLTTLAENINLDTCRRMKESTKTLTYHACNMRNVMGTLVSCFQLSSHCIHIIMQNTRYHCPEAPPQATKRPTRSKHHQQQHKHGRTRSLTSSTTMLPQHHSPAPINKPPPRSSIVSWVAPQ